MTHRHLLASSLRVNPLTWAQVLVAGVLLLAGGPAAHAADPPQQLRPITVAGEPVAPPPKDKAGVLLKGAGLCGGFRLADPAQSKIWFPLRDPGYPGTGQDNFANAINDLMDGVSGGGTNPPATYQTLQTPFDLASQVVGLGGNADGDFVMTPGCPSSAGCKFPASGALLDMLPPQYFGSRFRGFILISDGQQGQPFHVGFLTQNAVSMRVFTKAGQGQNVTTYEVISRASDALAAAYRVTNTLTFTKPGLYPIEILHANTANAAALEMAILTSNPTFPDVDYGAQQGQGPSALSAANFSLNGTMPARFFQTSSGALPFDGAPDQCKQCPRKYANQAGQLQTQTGCPDGKFCNEAAVCSPCVGDQFCGKSCKICTSPEPYCARDPASAGADYNCFECRDDPDCKSGQKCVGGKCISPCPCCPDAPFCVATDPAQPTARNCTACRTDSDCPGNKCDLLNSRCVDKIADCNTDDRCGPGCVNCGTSTLNDPQGPRPHCMGGQVCVQCRNDVECAAGTYCRSGDCVPCTSDRHCGPSCLGCGLAIVGVGTDGKTQTVTTEKPFCLAPSGQAPAAVCVRCLTDAQCGTGGTCDPATHECNTKCTQTCPADKICNGTDCVQCFTAAQCPCGQCINGECTANCGDSTDCRANQCCAQQTGLCTDGRCKPGLTANPGALCCDSTGGAIGGGKDPAAPVRSTRPLWLLLGALGLLGAARLRGRRAFDLGRGGRE